MKRTYSVWDLLYNHQNLEYPEYSKLYCAICWYDFPMGALVTAVPEKSHFTQVHGLIAERTESGIGYTGDYYMVRALPYSEPPIDLEGDAPVYIFVDKKDNRKVEWKFVGKKETGYWKFRYLE